MYDHLLFCLLKEIKEIKDDLMELKPTALAGVPRVFERVHEGKWHCSSSMFVSLIHSLPSTENIYVFWPPGVLQALEELNWRRRKIFHLLYK